MNKVNTNSTIDLIIPLYNESKHMVKHIKEMIQIVYQSGYEPHVILVDDGSQDDTWSIVNMLSNSYEEIEGVRLSRNFGKDNALFVGLRLTRGEAVITLDSDGQHPPSLIPSILKVWQEGAMVVNVVKKKRQKETFYIRSRACVFNYLMSKFMDSDQSGSSDYKLLDKQVAQVLYDYDSTHAIYRYSVANLGFPTANVPMETLPSERPSRWRLISLFQMAARAIMFHTDVPLKAFMFLMVLVVVMSLGLMAKLLGDFFDDIVPVGYSTILLVNLITLGVTVMGISGLAVYLKGMLDILTKRSGAIVWQYTSRKRSQKP